MKALNAGMVETEGLRAPVSTKVTSKAAGQGDSSVSNRPAEDIALAAMFLAGDDARWITGQVIVAAGGKRM